MSFNPHKVWKLKKSERDFLDNLDDRRFFTETWAYKMIGHIKNGNLTNVKCEDNPIHMWSHFSEKQFGKMFEINGSPNTHQPTDKKERTEELQAVINDLRPWDNQFKWCSKEDVQ